MPKMHNVAVLIDCPAEEVWSYLTTPDNWRHWYLQHGGDRLLGVETVRPDWIEGGEIVWSSIGGGTSRIVRLVPCKELAFDAGWEGVITFKLKAKGSTQTVFEAREEVISKWPVIEKKGIQEMLDHLKALVEKQHAPE
jgi:uncharacterized protein YndB with AHSA1/START domain